MTDAPQFGAKLLTKIVDRELQRARALIGVIGVATVATRLLVIGKLQQYVDSYRDQGYAADAAAVVAPAKSACYVGVAVGVAFLACAAFVFKRAVAATTVALVLWCAALVVAVVTDPRMLWQSPPQALFNVMITLGLLSAVRYARIYVANQRAREALPKAELVSKP